VPFRFSELDPVASPAASDGFLVVPSGAAGPNSETRGSLQSRLGGPVFSVKNAEYGAIGDGIADDTVAISAAITAAAAASPRGRVWFPRGTYKVTGNFNLTGLHGLSIEGEDFGAVEIDLAHATNDLFYYTTTTNDLTIRNLSITSSVARTGGWILHGTAAYNAVGRFLQFSRIANLHVKNQCNGIHLAGFRYAWMTDCLLHGFVGSGGVGIKLGQTAATDINQGVEAHLRNVHVVGQNLYTATGADPTLLDTAYWIEDCDGVYLEHCHGLGVLEHQLYMKAGGHGLYNHFFQDCVFDVTRNDHLVVITGSGIVQWIDFSGGYYASAGYLAGGATTARGFSIDASAASKIEIRGARIRNHQASGIHISSATTNDALITDCAFSENGYGATASDNHNIVVDVGANSRGPIIQGNRDSATQGANGVGLRTSATSNRVTVRDNIWPTGWTYGTAPEESDGNRTAIATGRESAVATVATAADTTETDLWTKTAKGAAFSRDGQSAKITAWGTCAANGNTKTLRAYIGSHAITINDVTTAPNGVQWTCEILFCRTGAATGKRIKRSVVGSAQQNAQGSAAVNETWASDVILRITGQNGTASASDIVLHHVLYEPLLDA
jgi:hypothetical protein